MRFRLLYALTLLALLLAYGPSQAQSFSLKMGKLKYKGGGDWYANPSAVGNLARFCNQQLLTKIDPNEVVVEVGSAEIFTIAFVHMTGHGNVVFSREEAENLRQYLISGGFLHIDDNYGMDKFIRREMKKVFPELDWKELGPGHPIYKQKFNFPKGLPKIHEHDGKPAQAFGLYWQGRLVCVYTYECDLSDGWEDPEVHNDPQDVRLKALQMGANLVQYAFSN